MNKDAVFNVSSFDLNKAVTLSKFFSRIKLSNAAKLTLRCLIDFWNCDNGFVFPKQTTISQCTGLSIMSISTAIAELKENKLLFTVKDGSRLNYYFMEQLFILTETNKASLPATPKNFKPGHKDTLSTYKQINITNNKQDDFKNFIKLIDKPDSFLNNRELARTILCNFHKYNIKSKNDLILIFLLGNYWNFSDKEFWILGYLNEEEKINSDMAGLIKLSKKEAEEQLKCLKIHKRKMFV